MFILVDVLRQCVFKAAAKEWRFVQVLQLQHTLYNGPLFLDSYHPLRSVRRSGRSITCYTTKHYSFIK